MRHLPILVAPLLTLALLASSARADDCGGRSVVTVHAGASATGQSASPWVELRWSASRDAPARWEARVGSAASLPLPGPEGTDDHAHLVVVAPRTERHFAVIDAAADHEAARRVRVYDARLRLVLALGLEDLMTADELARVSRSVSHIRWLAPEDPIRLDPDGETMHLALASGRVVSVALGAAPRVLR
ncbi:MAG: hypothetical protein IT385_15440 [Deltaproteobacteria bacterium]|nr:hypothetical protein [Deltaproteobacteria bacterium]